MDAADVGLPDSPAQGGAGGVGGALGSGGVNGNGDASPWDTNGARGDAASVDSTDVPIASGGTGGGGMGSGGNPCKRWRVVGLGARPAPAGQWAVAVPSLLAGQWALAASQAPAGRSGLRWPPGTGEAVSSGGLPGTGERWVSAASRALAERWPVGAPSLPAERSTLNKAGGDGPSRRYHCRPDEPPSNSGWLRFRRRGKAHPRRPCRRSCSDPVNGIGLTLLRIGIEEQSGTAS